ncbi:hypothetical protein [Cupriavidus sp. WS]|uniref:hypothetical protein n=1 Tax=Cupriavidus sp. WS TaxID=1312922 RepID=UPI0003A4E6C1|nr:hypothetical protein [Cupriavidus sp. WS]
MWKDAQGEQSFAGTGGGGGPASRCARAAVPAVEQDTRANLRHSWLRGEFRKIEQNVRDLRSKPPAHVLDYVLAGAYPAIEARSPAEVYWEHILLRYLGDVVLDIERNYSPDLKLSLVGTGADVLVAEGRGGGPLRGIAGIEASARVLNRLLPTTGYTIVDTIVRGNDRSGWVTEQWGYFDPATRTQVRDGIDTFQIAHGRIRTKMIHYTVETGNTYAEFWRDTASCAYPAGSPRERAVASRM